MKIFEKSENVYFEFLSYLINYIQSSSKPVSIEDVRQMFFEELYQKTEGDQYAGLDTVMNTMLPVVQKIIDEEGDASDKKSQHAVLFNGTKDKLEAAVPGRFPVRCNILEKQAAKSLLQEPTLPLFLEADVIEKLREVVQDIPLDWDISDIRIRNRQEGSAEKAGEMRRRNPNGIATIIEAIRWDYAICCDNIGTQDGDFRDSKVFPVKIEYSLFNDCFRIWAYDPKSDWFFKMNLSALRNIRIMRENPEKNLQEAFEQYLRENSASVRLRITDPQPHHIDRCFRIFSYYDREAEYDEETGEYTMMVTYQKIDRQELIKNILQMGPHMVVLKTMNDTVDIGNAVYERVKAASMRYQ